MPAPLIHSTFLGGQNLSEPGWPAVAISCHEPAQLEIVGLVVVEEPGLNLGLHLRIVPTLPRSKTLKYNQI